MCASFSARVCERERAPQKADVLGIDEARGARLPRSPYLGRSTPNAAADNDGESEKRAKGRRRARQEGDSGGGVEGLVRDSAAGISFVVLRINRATLPPRPTLLLSSLCPARPFHQPSLLYPLCAAPRIPTIVIRPSPDLLSCPRGRLSRVTRERLRNEPSSVEKEAEVAEQEEKHRVAEGKGRRRISSFGKRFLAEGLLRWLVIKRKEGQRDRLERENRSLDSNVLLPFDRSWISFFYSIL